VFIETCTNRIIVKHQKKFKYVKNIAEHILDISQNSIAADAKNIEISIIDSEKYNLVELKITDNGKGMSAEKVKQVTDPFYTSRTTRKVGLGIPLLKQNAELTGGEFIIESQINKGTTVTAKFIKNSIDILPFGDIAGSVILLVVSNPEIEFVYSHKTDKAQYVFDTVEVKNILGDTPLHLSEVRKYLIDMINENISELY